MKDILIFTAKEIGFKMVKSVVTEFPQDKYTIIVCGPNKRKLVGKFNKNGIYAEILSQGAVDRIKKCQSNSFDWLLNLWGGYIFDELMLSKFKYTLNVHPSLLPYCRGRDPVVWTIRYGLPAGVTLHEISVGVDSGAIWYQEEIPYSFPCTGGALYQKVVDKAVRLFCDNWGDIRSGAIKSKSQAQIGQKTFTRADLWADQCINLDGSISVSEFIRRMLAHDFNESYTAIINYDGKRYSARLKISEVEQIMKVSK